VKSQNNNPFHTDQPPPPKPYIQSVPEENSATFTLYYYCDSDTAKGRYPHIQATNPRFIGDSSPKLCHHRSQYNCIHSEGTSTFFFGGGVLIDGDVEH